MFLPLLFCASLCEELSKISLLTGRFSAIIETYVMVREVRGQMQKQINQILEGNFDYENGSLDFSCAKIELSVKRGDVYEGSFHILASPGRFCSGTVVSSDLRMECLTTEFIGCEEEISFCFHADNLEEGDVIKGNFYVVSNQGEYYLPFVVSVEHTVLESSVGAIRNLFHFANLAKTDWKEALKLFYSRDFIRVFQGTDAQYKDDYTALAVYNGSEQNMEEFLICINKKQKMEYLLQEEQLVWETAFLSGAYAVPEKEITIIRNGWGYTRLYIKCNGDFIFTEKETVGDEDFSGNRTTLPVYIDMRYCRQGRNYGEIEFYNAYVSYKVPVLVYVGESTAFNKQKTSLKRIYIQIMQFYEAFRLKKISKTTWLSETAKLVDKLVVMDENDISARLYQAQLLITEGRNNEAGWILDHVADLMEKEENGGADEYRAYYLYLSTLIHREPEYVSRVTQNVERIYRDDNSNWRVAWLLLYLSEEYHTSVTARWLFLEKQFELGCTSPAIYMEACLLVNNNPALLRNIGRFELQILWYGIRKEVLKSEVIEQMIQLADKVRDCSELLIKCFEKIYHKHSDNRVLQQLCSLLIKGGHTENKYFVWYKAGVEHKLKITNLYEYFMMSLNLKEQCDIPKEVLMYFSYQNNLDYEHTAYLYHYLLLNEDKLAEQFASFRPKMERFCIEQIAKLHINRHLGYIYSRLLTPELINERISKPLSKILFAHLLHVENKNIRKVYVYHSGNKYPTAYNMGDGETWIALYGNNYTIVFEDGYRHRFIKNVDYTLEKLMLPGKLLRVLTGFDIDNPELELFLSTAELDGNITDQEAANRIQHIIESDYVEDDLRHKLSFKLLQYYYESDNVRALDDFLFGISPDDLTAEERGKIMYYFVVRGYLDIANQWLEAYGPYHMDAKLLLRLLTALLEQSYMIEDKLLVASAYYVFQKGKYNSIILSYLVNYYQGLTRNMRDIWKVAKSFDIDCYKLDENILVQMLYSGAFVGEKMAIFNDYIAQGAKPEIEDAFLTQCSYEFFAKDRVTDQGVFDEIQRMYIRGEVIQRISKLAYLKYYAENYEEMTSETERIVNEFLPEMFDDGIYLEFFRVYRNNDRVMQEMADKTIIEYRVNPMAKACIHYVILHENGDADEYTADYMKEAYRGVCFMDFVLFFGESLQYYITEEMNGEEQLTESGILQNSEIQNNSGDTRYHMINDIVISKTLEDYDTMEMLLEEYHKKDFMIDKLFELK